MRAALFAIHLTQVTSTEPTDVAMEAQEHNHRDQIMKIKLCHYLNRRHKLLCHPKFNTVVYNVIPYRILSNGYDNYADQAPPAHSRGDHFLLCIFIFMP